MAKILFEDREIEIFEDRHIIETNYKIENNKLVTKKVIEQSTYSSIYDYQDGYSMYIKSDEASSPRMMLIMLAIYDISAEKTLSSIPETNDIKVRRYGKFNFLITTDDVLNKQGSLTFVNVPEDGSMSKICINYTELVSLEVFKDKYVIANYYEDAGKNNLWTIAVFSLEGKIIKSLIDKNVKKGAVFSYVLDFDHNGKYFIQANTLKFGRQKRLTKYMFDMKYTEEDKREMEYLVAERKKKDRQFRKKAKLAKKKAKQRAKEQQKRKLQEELKARKGKATSGKSKKTTKLTTNRSKSSSQKKDTLIKNAKTTNKAKVKVGNSANKAPKRVDKAVKSLSDANLLKVEQMKDKTDALPKAPPKAPPRAPARPPQGFSETNDKRKDELQ